MNSHFEQFKNVGTAGKVVEFEGSNKIFVEWIISLYKNKNVNFLMTNGFFIFPLEMLDYFCTIKCIFRIKKSGSSKVGIGKSHEVIKFLYDNTTPFSFRMTEDGRVFINDRNNIDHFNLNGSEYFISKRNDEYEVRLLSHTKHANVIFTLGIKYKHNHQTHDSFLEYLKLS